MLSGEGDSEQSHPMSTLSGIDFTAADWELWDDENPQDLNRDIEEGMEVSEISDFSASDAFLVSTLEHENSSARGEGLYDCHTTARTLETSPQSAPPPVTGFETPRTQWSGKLTFAPSRANIMVPGGVSASKPDQNPMTTTTAQLPTRSNVLVAPGTGEYAAGASASPQGVQTMRGEWPKNPLGCQAHEKARTGLPQDGAALMGGADPAGIGAGIPPLYDNLRSSCKKPRSLSLVLSAPRIVRYECSACKMTYQAEVSSNPWWSLLRQECPGCHRIQVPRVDATSAANDTDRMLALCAKEVEDWPSDG